MGSSRYCGVTPAGRKTALKQRHPVARMLRGDTYGYKGPCGADPRKEGFSR
jgi:hypothetical protein